MVWTINTFFLSTKYKVKKIAKKIFLTVGMVSGGHVCSSAAVNNCVRGQVRELGQRSQQRASIWLQNQTVRGQQAISARITKQPRGQRDRAKSEAERTHRSCFSDNLHGPFSLCRWSQVQPPPDLWGNLFGGQQKIRGRSISATDISIFMHVVSKLGTLSLPF